MQKRALGRGLSALIPENTNTEVSVEEKERIIYIPVNDVKPNPYQPRKEFKEQELEDLAQSIREKGVIQPIIVRRMGPHYELIAGERRLRAVKSLQINEIPAILKDVSDEESLELSLIENVQREQLNPIEEALSYKHLVDKFGVTQERISITVGKARASVANFLRLLNLPQEIQDEIRQGRISFAHGKVLLELDDVNLQRSLAWKIVSHGLTVSELSGLVKQKCPNRPRAKKLSKILEPNLFVIQENLQHLLGTKVILTKGKKRGNIQIEFYSQEDLQRIIGLILKTV